MRAIPKQRFLERTWLWSRDTKHRIQEWCRGQQGLSGADCKVSHMASGPADSCSPKQCQIRGEAGEERGKGKCKGTARRPLSTSKTSPTPDSREHIPMTITTSPHLKSISETLLKLPINSNTSTSPMSKFVSKVETTPPTKIVYMDTKELRPSTYQDCLYGHDRVHQSNELGNHHHLPHHHLHDTDPSVPHQLLHHHACDREATDKHYQYLSRDNYQESHHSRDQFSQYHHSGEISHNHDPTLFLCPNNPHNPRHSDLLCDRYHTKDYPNHCKYPRSPVSDPNNYLVSTFQTSTAIIQAPTSNDTLTTPTTQVVAVATEASTELGTRKTTPLNTMSSTNVTLTPVTDTPKETLTTSITSISPTMSSITPTNAITPATLTTSKSSPVPTSTDTYTISTTKGPLSTTVATTEIGKMSNTTPHASSTRKTTFITTSDVGTESLTSEITSAPPITKSDTPTNTLNYSTSTTSTSVTTNTLTSPTSKSQSSPPAQSTEAVLNTTTNTTSLSPLITTIPTTKATSTPPFPTSTVTTTKTEITTLTDTSTPATSKTTVLPITSTTKITKTGTTNIVTTPTSITPQRTPDITSSTNFSTGRTMTPANTESTSSSTTGPLTPTTDLSTTLALSSTSPTPTNIIPSSPSPAPTTEPLFNHLHDREQNHICIPVIPPYLCYGADGHNYTSILWCYHTPGNHAHANNTPKLSSCQLFNHLHDREQNHICIPIIPPYLCYGADGHNYTSILYSSHHRVHILEYHWSIDPHHRPQLHTRSFQHLTHPHKYHPIFPFTCPNHRAKITTPMHTEAPAASITATLPISATTPRIEVGTIPEVTSTPTIPLSVFTSTTEKATSPSSTTMTTVFPAKTDTSTSVFKTDPTNMTDAPSSISTGTIPINTDFTSTQRPTSGTWISTNFVTTQRVPGSTSLPVTMKPSSSFSTAMMTSSKLTHPIPPITSTPGIPAATTKTLSTLTSPRTTSTTTQMTTQSRLTTTPGTCDNGGTWMQSHCYCPSTFSGSRCEFAVEHIDMDKVDTEVGMEVSVNKEFSLDLNDNSSKAYRDFTDTFRDQMKKIYQNVQGFKEVVILSLRNGSIVVDYVVQLELPFSPQLESEYEKVKVALKEELRNVSQNETGCQKDQAICRNAAAVGYEDFYFPLVKGNKLRCVTKCAAGVDGALDCRQGQCVLQRTGPSCRCFSTDTHWFSGPRCEVAISWKALVGGLAGTAALLLLLLVWFETSDENTVGTFSNSGFEDDRTNENFYVALENVDTNMTFTKRTDEVLDK
ncbi:hypothetical protein E2I00_014916 [Balaenoptera physalus]|uniref:SEA domain-containing protein n=1 Tax=Balaenoptera physalus TaxID=9770 RepID=A0A643CE26_BALPH|nr:hypothetical protein E2I00_014916 [Balaenoptera physalus]